MLDKEKCTGCTACVNTCPTSAISMIEDEEGFAYPQINQETCIKCNKCIRVCQVEKTNTSVTELTVYAVQNSDDSIREKSSSGGVFYALAKKILLDGGVVVGCAFNEGCREATHIVVNTIEDLPKLMGSKYLQSNLTSIYKDVKKYLDANCKVLFSGTPCQVAGLKTYLGKNQNNLITVDFICHGVPSPKVWRRYVTFREQKSASTTQRMFFRHKKYGWKTFSVLFEFTNNTEYVMKQSEDPYMRGFIGNLYLRPSCYQCVFKGTNYYSDITLADFWGVEKAYPKFDDDKGTSLVIIHSDWGKALINAVTSEMRLYGIPVETALKSNPSYNDAASMNHWRKSFFSDFSKNRLPFDKLIYKYFGHTLYAKLWRYLFH